MTCPACALLQAELDASRMRNAGLKARVLCLETDLGNAQTLIAGAYKRVPAAVSPGAEQFPGQFDVGAGASVAWTETLVQAENEAAHARAVARNLRPAWWDTWWGDFLRRRFRPVFGPLA